MEIRDAFLALVSNTPSMMVSVPPWSATPSSRQVNTSSRRWSTRSEVGEGASEASRPSVAAGGTEGPSCLGGMVTWPSTVGFGAKMFTAAKPTTITRERMNTIRYRPLTSRTRKDGRRLAARLGDLLISKKHPFSNGASKPPALRQLFSVP